MRLGVFTLLALSCARLAAAQPAVSPFGPSLPQDIGDVAGWEVVSGEFETVDARGAYMFYVNPERLAMYQLMRYQLEFKSAGAGPSRQRPRAERVAFVRHPGVREPIECWEKQAPGGTTAWRRISAGTDEYTLEMAALMYMLSVHRAARSAE